MGFFGVEKRYFLSICERGVSDKSEIVSRVVASFPLRLRGELEREHVTGLNWDRANWDGPKRDRFYMKSLKIGVMYLE